MKIFKDFVDIVAKLRSPQGCPWDREQVPENYKDYLREEVEELIDAIEKNDIDNIKEELGDVLLLVVMLSQIYSEDDHFQINDVLEGIRAKMIHRHPHVFGDVKVKDAEEVLENWKKIKAEEKAGF